MSSPRTWILSGPLSEKGTVIGQRWDGEDLGASTIRVVELEPVLDWLTRLLRREEHPRREVETLLREHGRL